MFAWTKQMNFTRWVIVLAFAASIAFGALAYTSRAKLAQIEAQTDTLTLLGFDIVRQSHELQSLRKIASTRQDLDNLNTYITSIAARPAIEIGSVDITSNKKSAGVGLEDEIFSIKPPKIDRNPEYSRTRIANFAHTIEKGTAVRVTRLRIFPPTHVRTPAHEIGQDIWTFEMEVRQRKRTATAGAS